MRRKIKSTIFKRILQGVNLLKVQRTMVIIKFYYRTA